MLAPVVLLVALEIVLRFTWRSAALPLFVSANVERPGYLVANREIARRWFFTEQSPPVPIPDAFAAEKPAHSFRVFVLGESTTAGFPYPHNGAFSRVLADALRDVLPDDSVEVVNLGIPATNSYALVDMVDEINAQHPDAVLIYAGHNEYYGALGAASTEGGLHASPALVRGFLFMQRSRLVFAMRRAATWLRTRSRSASGGEQAPSFMETLAGDQQIDLNGRVYLRGEAQFASNLDEVCRRFAGRGVPVFVGSLTSNVRDQAPLSSPANAQTNGADGTFARARAALAAGDTTHARPLFVQARDQDVVRFRAPSEFNEVIRRVTHNRQAIYVPVAEAFDSAAVGGVPGYDLFLEHVHPNVRGEALLARLFFDALRRASFVGRQPQIQRLQPWSTYVARMDLTPFDERVAYHTVQTLAVRWPFVPASNSRDYRATYRPTGVVDSASFLVSRGYAWGLAKAGLAKWYVTTGHADSAVAELAGLARDAPLYSGPWELLGEVAAEVHEDSTAAIAFGHAVAIRPTLASAVGAATLAMRRRDFPTAVQYFRLATTLDPTRPEFVYQLSLAYGAAHDIENARATAVRVARMAPGLPGLGGWLKTIGLTR
ncbi:MAG TPA: GDSL-type esterase/lipase family protein [Gemmatimonadaceae bacterium]